MGPAGREVASFYPGTRAGIIVSRGRAHRTDPAPDPLPSSTGEWETGLGVLRGGLHTGLAAPSGGDNEGLGAFQTGAHIAQTTCWCHVAVKVLKLALGL